VLDAATSYEHEPWKHGLVQSFVAPTLVATERRSARWTQVLEIMVKIENGQSIKKIADERARAKSKERGRQPKDMQKE
jgi:hypothetical protein